MALQYEYTPLDKLQRDIRLIKLQPCAQLTDIDNSKSVIRCRIVRACLDEDPVYTALSYTWGDPKITNTIMLDQFVYEVTENLHAALLHLRHDTKELTLWIDAICINQRDEEEKSWQVQQMRDVYKKASLVTVWLGPASDNSDLAIEKLKAFGDKVKHHRILELSEYQFRASQWLGRELPGLHLGEDGTTLENILSDMSVGNDVSVDLPASPILAILSRSSWQRIWVLQEISVAKSSIFQCGRKTIDIDSLSAALTAFRLYLQAISGTLLAGPFCCVPEGFDARPYMMLSTRRTELLEMFSIPLKRLLQVVCKYTRKSRRLDSTDPRDCVYALLGLARDAQELGIYADYTKPCWQVFTEVARAMIKADENPWVLHLCYFPKRQTDLPSWVPDWSAFSQQRELPTGHEFGADKPLFANVIPPFTASGSMKYIQESQGEDIQSIRLKATIVDVIKAPLRDEFKRNLERQFDLNIPGGQTDWNSSLGFYRASESDGIYQNFDAGSRRQRQISEETPRPQSTFAAKPGQAPPDYIYLKSINPRWVVGCIDLVQEFVAAVRSLAVLGDNIYGSASKKEEAIWRTLIGDQQPDEDDKFDKWHRPARSHYYLNLLHLLKNQGEVAEELKDFMDECIAQRALDKLLEWDILGKLDIDIMRKLSFGSSGQPYEVEMKPRSELIPKLFALGAMADLEITLEQYEEAARTGKPPFNEEDYTSRFMMQVSKAFYVDDDKEIEQEFMELAEVVMEYLVTARTQLIGRNVFVTHMGLIGLGPQHLQTGDLVLIMPGLDVPFVVRPREDHSCQLVGEAYVHGVMDGEVVRPETDWNVIEIY